jgi:predicted component of type VI protein secretion system
VVNPTKNLTLDSHDFTSTRALDSRLFPAEDSVTTCGWLLVGRLVPGGPRVETRIASSPFLIGRCREHDLPIASRNVSKAHAEIVVAGDALFVRDLGSTNGTTVNGRPLPGRSAMPIGEEDVVRFADMSFRIGRDEGSPFEF